MKHLEFQIKDITQQFTDQVKAIESKVTVDTGILNNILDLYKRRAVIEQDYAENLLKLTSSITQKKNLENLRRPKWKNHSSVKVLNSLLASTELTAKSHKNLGDLYSKQMTTRILDMQDDCARLTKRSTDILQRRYAQILKSINQLLVKQKVYNKLYNETEECRRKVTKSVDLLNREVLRCQDKKRELDKNSKIKKLKEDYSEKFKCYTDKQVECTTTRNRYIIHLFSLKDSINHFYSKELNTILQCTQYGFHNNLTRLSMSHESSEQAMFTVHTSISKLFVTTIDDIDGTNDTKLFFDANKSVFTLKEQLQFNSARDDNITDLIKTGQKVEHDLRSMLFKFNTERKNVSNTIEDRKSHLDSISGKYNDLINQADFDVVEFICYQSQADLNMKEKTNSARRDSASNSLYCAIQKKIKEPKIQMENHYFKVMEVYLNDQINMIDILSKLGKVETALNGPTFDHDKNSIYKSINIHPETASIIGMKPKLFGGDLKKYSLETGELVPIVVRSCIRLINLYGMSNEGVFRIPGSQTDVVIYRSQFELGSDPISTLTGSAYDVNVAASLLKLYFRELDPPIFDQNMFNKIVENYTLVKQNEDAIVDFMKVMVGELDLAVYCTVDYLVSFLRHLSEFSKGNCMDVPNLAIIFGPCLMPIPEDKNCQLFHFQAIINHVTQCLITYHDPIFTQIPNVQYNRNQSTSIIEQLSNLEPESVKSNKSDKLQFFEDSFEDQNEDELVVDYNKNDDLGTSLKEDSDSFSSLPQLEKLQTTKKIRLDSMASESDSELNSKNGTVPVTPLENPFDLYNIDKLQIFDGVVNIANDRSETKSEVYLDENYDKVDDQMIRIRSSSLVRPNASFETSAIVDDDLRETMQGLQRIEQLNVLKHRSTIQIDQSLLASKFVSPIRPDLITYETTSNSNKYSDITDSNVVPEFDFPLKPPEEVSFVPMPITYSPTLQIVGPSTFHGSNTSLDDISKSSSSDGFPMMPIPPPPTHPKPNIDKN